MGRTGRLLANQSAHKNFLTKLPHFPQWPGAQRGIGDPPSAKEAVEAAHINIAVAISSRRIFFI